ncbi:c-type cytochrome [Nitrogeniibacter aestuarii]|uniref:c-type cytochrome n=1 Tax=Nitrogeniibacter aestuarii TaxID=2815343 RepID=UPI001E39D3E1|nr:cytochrome c [Nitrogeniibacter aestuarii]
MKRVLTLAGLLAALCGGTVFAAGMEIPEPDRGLMASPAKGRPLFERTCASCHGQDLAGTKKGPPLVHKIYEPSHHSDASFQLAARYGTRAHHWGFGDMPPVEGVDANDVAHIIAYVRAQQRRAGIR